MRQIKSKQIAIADQKSLVGNASGNGTELAVGTNGQILTVVSGAVAWAAAPAGSATPDDTEVVYAAATVTTGTATLTSFFSATLSVGAPVVVYFNGIKLKNSNYSVSGTDLLLDIDDIGYSLESGDVIYGTYFV